jgi:amino acid adenylation domain-containing protein
MSARREFVHEWFLRIASRAPSRVAIEAGDRRVTYGALAAATRTLAAGMRARGAQPGTPVLVVANDRIAVMTAFLASLAARTPFVPVFPDTPPEQLVPVLRACEPELALVAASLRDAIVEAFRRAGRRAETIVLEDFDPNDDRTDAPAPVDVSEPDDCAYVLYTSGSTGTPKGISGRLKGIDHFIRWEIGALGLADDVRVSQLTVPTFDAFLRDMFVPLCTGGTSCVPTDGEVLLDGERLLQWIDTSGITLVHCVPSLFRSLLPFAGAVPLHALRHVLLAGEPVLLEDVRRWSAAYGDRIQLVNLYGPSETTMTKFVYWIKSGDQHRRAIPIGKPIDGARALVLNDDGRPARQGLVGEIYIRTPYMSLGYYKDPEATARSFVPNPLTNDPADPVYRTGDYARVLEDGEFEFVGRRDSQVKIRGVRIDLAEIENVIRTCPAVRDAAVFDQQDTQHQACLCAYVAVEDSEIDAVRTHVATRVPPYMCPSAFIAVDGLPRTATGKVDRQALRRVHAAAGWLRDYAPPRNSVEQALADIWTEVLGLERIGIHDNFFERGGHSLLAMQVVSRVRRRFTIELPVRTLFLHPTIALLAPEVGRALEADAAAAAPILEPRGEMLVALAEIERLSEAEARTLLGTHSSQHGARS